VLAEQGVLSYDLRIADVWPAYARHGKQDTTLRHALLHTGGVPQLPSYTTAEDLLDWDRMCRTIAGSAPMWEPGTRHGLHEWTYGWLIGEVVRRTAHKPIAWVLAEEIAHPLGADRELFFGVPPEQLHRVAPLTDRTRPATRDRFSAGLEHFDASAPPGVRPDATLANRRDILRADIPAAATVSARAVARMYAALMGDVGGVRLVSPDRLELIAAGRSEGPDWAIGADLPKTLGYVARPGCGRIGWNGDGGGLAGFYPELHLALAATRNHLCGGEADPLEDIAATIHDAVVTAGVRRS